MIPLKLKLMLDETIRLNQDLFQLPRLLIEKRFQTTSVKNCVKTQTNCFQNKQNISNIRSISIIALVTVTGDLNSLLT